MFLSDSLKVQFTQITKARVRPIAAVWSLCMKLQTSAFTLTPWSFVCVAQVIKINSNMSPVPIMSLV